MSTPAGYASHDPTKDELKIAIVVEKVCRRFARTLQGPALAGLMMAVMRRVGMNNLYTMMVTIPELDRLDVLKATHVAWTAARMEQAPEQQQLLDILEKLSRQVLETANRLMGELR